MKKVILFALLVGSCLWSSLQAVARPNIVFLLADDMNRDTWGAYGGKDCKTPNIDKLAAAKKYDKSKSKDKKKK